MLVSIQEADKLINSGKNLMIAGEEKLLKNLQKGDWIGGTIPYFIAETGGVFSQEKVFVNEIPDFVLNSSINWYDKNTLSKIAIDAPDNGFTLIVIPSGSQSHIEYAQKAPNYEQLFLKPIIGWISGVNLADLGKISPKVINGKTGEISDSNAIVMHLTLPSKKVADIGIINIFRQGNGDKITFDEEGFSIKDCLINGKKQSFSKYLLDNKIDVKLPLVANYSGAMVNVSIQEIKKDENVVNLYAPVFKEVEYRAAKPISNYTSEFTGALPKESILASFSCNCILNYLYSELEGKKTGNFAGPITFGEIAYQLLNQTLVYLQIKDL
jgi:hypothetical protein